jgi:hypothetical protein
MNYAEIMKLQSKNTSSEPVSAETVLNRFAKTIAEMQADIADLKAAVGGKRGRGAQAGAQIGSVGDGSEQ